MFSWPSRMGCEGRRCAQKKTLYPSNMGAGDSARLAADRLPPMLPTGWEGGCIKEKIKDLGQRAGSPVPSRLSQLLTNVNPVCSRTRGPFPSLNGPPMLRPLGAKHLACTAETWVYGDGRAVTAIPCSALFVQLVVQTKSPVISGECF